MQICNMINKIQEQVNLKHINTFRVDVSADKFLAIHSESDLFDFFKSNFAKEPRFILGGGSNVLFTKNFKGTILKMEIDFIQILEEGDENVLVEAGAGVNWNSFVWYCIEKNLAGIENMALIPGTVGAAPIQNIGAYGMELMDVFHSCRAFDTLHNCWVTLMHADCQFSYRDSIFKNAEKGRYIITSVVFNLQKTPNLKMEYAGIKEEMAKNEIKNPSIKDMAEIISQIRTFKLPDPSEIGNAGSFFKNPLISPKQVIKLKDQYPDLVHYTLNDEQSKVAAGWLIEKAGWKGKSIGSCATWKNQALVIVNLGDATGEELFQFSQKIVEDVEAKFGISLEREVNIL